VGYTGRRFECGWDDRRETAAELAHRLVWLAQRLGTIDPAYGRMRLDPGARKFRDGDPGPIATMQRTDLAALIDRDRFDPPSAPKPVSPQGFSLLFRNDLAGYDPSFAWLLVRAGRYGLEDSANRVRFQPESKHELWRDISRGVQVLDMLIESWEPQWACAYALAHDGRDTGQAGNRARPWLAWTAKPSPDTRDAEPYPPPFPLDHAGLPAQTRPLRGGELCVWP
jgi:hypothetical protein